MVTVIRKRPWTKRVSFLHTYAGQARLAEPLHAHLGSHPLPGTPAGLDHQEAYAVLGCVWPSLAMHTSARGAWLTSAPSLCRHPTSPHCCTKIPQVSQVSIFLGYGLISLTLGRLAQCGGHRWRVWEDHRLGQAQHHRHELLDTDRGVRIC